MKKISLSLPPLLMLLIPTLLSAATPEPLTEDNSWAFHSPEDSFTNKALLDLRSLNEEVAGENGFIRKSEDGTSFVREDGQPIRFWSILRRIDGKNDPSDAELENFYRVLAKRGINMVRLFGQLSNNAEGASLENVDEEQIRRFQKHVAIAKKNGIYSVISPYWSHSKAPKSWKLEGREAGGSPFAYLFTSERFRKAYKGWMRELLTRPNPHTGIALKDEPAVAIIQVQNEDSLLWFQTQNLPEAQKRNLRRAFAQWLTRKYGSLEAGLRQWPKASMPKDSAENSEAGLYSAWELGQPASGDKAKRLADQLAFLASFQRGVYEEIEAYFRSLGASQLTSASNWKTVNDPLLLDVERYIYADLDVVAMNRYTGPDVHQGNNSGWSVRTGHEFSSISTLEDPARMPFSIKQPAGHPFALTEHFWTYPNRYLAEGSFLTAAYSSLTGLDMAMWSMATSIEINNSGILPWSRGRNAWMHKFNAMGPETLFQFPAAALAFRMGLISTADQPAVREARPLEKLWKREQPLISEKSSFDPLTDVPEYGQQQSKENEVDARAFLVGPVVVDFHAEPGSSQMIDLNNYVKNGRIQSLTREITLDPSSRLCAVDAPGFQGVVGFFKEYGEAIHLSDVTLECGNEYAAVSVVSMDGQPLSESGKILIQVGTVYRPTGWETEPATIKSKRHDSPVEGLKIVNIGEGPWRAANTDLSIHVRNTGISKATLLDVNGYPRKNLETIKENDGLSLKLPSNAMYVILSN